MADKKLLEESTIRRFMKLANIDDKSSTLLRESKHGQGAGLANKGGNHHKGYKGGAKVHEETADLEQEGYEEEGKHGGSEGYEQEGYEEEGYEQEVDEEDPESMDPGAEGEPGLEGEPDDMSVGDGEGEGSEDEIKMELETIAKAASRLAKLAGGTSSMEAVPDEGGENMDEEDMTAPPSPMEERRNKMKDEARKMPKDQKGHNKVEQEGYEEEGDSGELDESINVVDEDLINRLVSRVSARLVREAKAAKQKAINESEFESHKAADGQKAHKGHKMVSGMKKVPGGDKSGFGMAPKKHLVKKKKHSSR